MVKKKRKEFRITRSMRQKMVVLFLVIVALLGALLCRILYIHFVQGDKYTKKVLDQQEYSSKTIPYKRGNIIDRNGTILATSEAVYNVILDCKVVNSDVKYKEPTVKALSDCFELTSEELITILEENPKSQYTVLKKKLTYDKIEDFLTIQEDTKNHPYVKGVWFEKEYQRYYPYNSLGCSVLGFTAAGNAGINGLENYYNSTLNGVDGREYGYLNSDSNYETTVKAPVNGNTVVSTIDTMIQSIVEKKIKAFNKEHKNLAYEGLGSENTAVVVMNPNNAEILAMADYPFYNLNQPRNLSNFLSDKQIENMTDDEQLDFLNDIWSNFCITYTYEPGSTVKPFTVATGLETGKLKGNETFICDGAQKVGGHTIHCVNRNGHGKETIKEAIMNSCNDALMQIGAKIGITNFCKYQNIFGFGLKTNIDIPGEARTDTLIHPVDTMNATDLATNSFGQNFNVTMVQVASAFSSLINGGDYYQPHLVKEIRDDEGSTVSTVEPKLLKQTVSKETSDLVKSYLYATVQSGTAQSAKVEGYTMGGKTGTAQKIPRTAKKYLVSFIGYAPADDPQVLVYVVINEPNDENQAQSSFATTMAKEILEEVLPYMNIYPDEGKEDTYTGKVKTIEENYTGDIFD